MQPFLYRLKSRARVLRAIRRYFDSLEFIEVDTALAITAPAPELHIEAPSVLLQTTPGKSHKRYLQTSPELAMKRLLALGAKQIYQIAPVFRDGDYGQQHRPEFRMLEWYRSGDTWMKLLDDCEQLLRKIAVDLTGQPSFRYQGQTIDLSKPFLRVSVEEAFTEHAGFSILESLDVASLRIHLKNKQIPFNDSDEWDDLFHRVFLTLVEPKLLQTNAPFFLTHYPAPLASLAQLSPQDPRVAERVELYVGKMELANGFGELVCPILQRERFEQARQKRSKLGAADYPIDNKFLNSLEHLPPSAGMALGVDRLIMLALDLPTIDETLSLPWDDS